MLRETEEKNRLKSGETRNGFTGGWRGYKCFFYLAMESSLPGNPTWLSVMAVSLCSPRYIWVSNNCSFQKRCVVNIRIEE